MRTVTFKSVLHGIALRMGLEPEENLQVNQAQAITEYINTRTREAWEWADWPEMVATEERAFADDHDLALIYATGDIVWDPTGRVYYTALQSVPAATALSDAAYWEETATADITKTFQRSQAGKTEIGDVFNIYLRDPRENANPGELDWFPEDEGYRVNTVNSTVWVYYRKTPSIFTETPYSASTPYTAGQRVYSSTTGECYLAIASSTGIAVTDTTKWTKIDMPRILSEAIKCAAYADTLREAGQGTRANEEEARYEAILIFEMDKITTQAGRWPRWKAQVQ